MAGLHARAVRHFNEAQYRANAADVVHGAIAAMRTMGVTTLATRFDQSTRADGWSALLDQAKRLPGVTDTQNVPALMISDGPTTTSRTISLDVFWQTPGDARVHRYPASAVIGGN